MNRPLMLRAATLMVLAGLLLGTPGAAQVSTPPRPAIRPPTGGTTAFVPRFEAVAETRLLMEGMAHSNYRSVNRLLSKRPADNETWSFARGQAILIAETGNLLLLRPPKNTGRDTWMKLAMDMRDRATALARQSAARNHAGSKTALAGLTASCNRCHQTFRVATRVAPDPDPAERDAE